MYTSIILAAGEGTRMKSSLPKVLHKVCGKEMIKYVVEASQKSGIDKNIVIIGHGIDKMIECLKTIDNVIAVEQPIGSEFPYGTGYAVMKAVEYINDNDTILLINGDGPLITSETLMGFIKFHENGNYQASVMTAIFENPTGYGRIVRNSDNTIKSIVEQKDTDEEIRKIKEINTGIYCYNGKMLKDALGKIDTNNSQNEYYITDTIKVLNNQGFKIGGYIISDESDIKAVNDRIQLSEVERIMQKRINNHLMFLGVTIINPENTYIEDNVVIGNDTIIYPNTILEKGTKIGSRCIIGPNTRIINSEIKDNVTIESSKVIDSYVDDKSSIGPFAYLRPNSKIGKNVKIGDFVEVKNSVIGDNTKASHLSYIGDGEVGDNVNIGCGVVFVNYDGKKKHKTIIENGAFVGSNSNLIAPVTIKENAYIACGSTITDDVESEDLAIARARQVNKKGLGKNRY